ncbi:flavoprotein [Hymenobacter elongatus]|uniref:Flavoprotein domain-containing protein n=1 Tax=Hymenobacter elongatus TaxID=877208 RepID=A0A4Z0PJG0_9BACT|nr:flavoprotein [Hymenobacter elongatus]TGE15018.1 hypothetical protein E5J99_14015 [Hymenobacter elongatus]
MNQQIITICAGGVIETALLPYHLVHLTAHYDLNTRIAISQHAEKFVSELSLQCISKNAVYTENKDVDVVTGLPYHILYSHCDLLLIRPATARIVAECALGIITCPVTRLFSFVEKKKIIMCFMLHPRMEKNIYAQHIINLKNLGVMILGFEDERSTDWTNIEQVISQRLNLCKKDDVEQVRIVYKS